ncbi:hypothetical protein DL93DRAFT_115783 [Clavulina sp. PMI_390]|nr:hypothetical protein DL93DRAFT_115783 [Clavulina sp. PMI_390]
MGNASNVVCPPSFKRFAQQTIYQVSASAGSCFLALWYIEHLPIGPVLSDIDNLIIYDTPQRSFRDDLIATRAEIPWRLLTLGLTLANKWLEDNTFTMKTWNEVTGLNIGMMKVLEAKALGLFNWILNPDMGLWEEFLHKLRHREVMIHAGHLPGAIGSERRLSMSFSEPATLKRPIRVIDELIAEAAASKVVKEPVFPGAVPPFSPVETASSAPSPVSPATSVADSFGSVSAASSVRSIPHPLPSPHAEPEWSARRASWTSEINFDFARDDPPVVFGGHSRRVKTPAEWNPLVDESVGRRTRPVYEAVQRPNSLLLIPPPAAYEDYVAPGFAGVPPAKYAEHNPRQQVMSMYALGTTIPRVPQYEQAVNGNGATNGMIDRVWSDARNIMPDLRANWAPSLAGY